MESMAMLNAIVGIYLIPIGCAILAGIVWIIIQAIHKIKRRDKDDKI